MLYAFIMLVDQRMEKEQREVLRVSEEDIVRFDYDVLYDTDSLRGHQYNRSNQRF